MNIVYPEHHEKIWGSEEWIVNDEKYCGKILIVKRGYQCSYHYHKLKDETFYILEGMVNMIIEGESELLAQGESVRIYPYMKHRFVGVKDSQILEISTQHFENDSYRLDPSGKVK